MKKPKRINKKESRKMERVASTGEWRGLIKLEDIPAFSSWLTDERHEWISQSPDVGEVLRIYRHGITRSAKWNGRQTVCGRHLMALWHTFCCFRDG